MSLYPIPVGLAPVDKNKLTNYWPIRNKGNEFDWDTVTGVCHRRCKNDPLTPE